MSEAMVVMTTVDGEAAARALAERLLEGRFAACVQELRIASRYRWEGELRCDAEILLLVKTSKAGLDAAMRCIEENHGYEVPEILAIPASSGLPAYLEWIARETAAGNPG